MIESCWNFLGSYYGFFSPIYHQGELGQDFGIPALHLSSACIFSPNVVFDVWLLSLLLFTTRYTHTYIYTVYTHIYIYTLYIYIYTLYIYIYINKYTEIYTYIHTYVRTYIHTYVRTYIHTCMPGLPGLPGPPKCSIPQGRHDATRKPWAYRARGSWWHHWSKVLLRRCAL